MTIPAHLHVDPLVVETPWQRPPLTANQRLHWRKKAALTKEIRQWAGVLFRTARFSTIPIVVQLDWHVPDRRRRDVDNTVPTLKALCDGLVDADIVPDDIPSLMAKTMPEIRYAPNETQRIELWIEEVPA